MKENHKYEHVRTDWTATSKTYLRTCAPSEDSDQPAHSRSLIRIITRRILDSHGSKVSSYGRRRLWSEYAGWFVYSLGAHFRRHFSHVTTRLYPLQSIRQHHTSSFAIEDFAKVENAGHCHSIFFMVITNSFECLRFSASNLPLILSALWGLNCCKLL